MRICKYLIYWVRLLHIEFMTRGDMFDIIGSNNFKVCRDGEDYVLLDVNGIDVQGLTEIGYDSPEDCVKAILRYHRDK